MSASPSDSAAAALEDIADGATVLISGFGGAGFPNALIAALRDTRVRHLTLVMKGPVTEKSPMLKAYEKEESAKSERKPASGDDRRAEKAPAAEAKKEEPAAEAKKEEPAAESATTGGEA